MMVRLRHNVVVGKRLYAAGSMVDPQQPGFEFVLGIPDLAIVDAQLEEEAGPVEESSLKGGPALPVKVHKPPGGVVGAKGTHLVRKAK
jgi:hypothetical protein